MIKRVKQSIPRYSSLKTWSKRILGTIVIAFSIFASGTFYPNEWVENKLDKKYEEKYLSDLQALDLREPEFSYTNDTQFVRATHKCIDYLNFKTAEVFRVPYEMITAQAALESGWGTSRFAMDGNNLFGIRTWNEDTPHMIPLSMNQKKWPGWGVRIFASKCESVKEYIRLMNEHPAYEKFRKMRTQMLADGGDLDSTKLITTLDKFSTTPDYAKRVIVIIKKIRKYEEKI
tara:strand:+ start:3811 stop:4503 length:693 start_codon:yes stop_codon:yes gene_type:complete